MQQKQKMIIQRFSFPPDSPPLSVISAAKISGIPLPPSVAAPASAVPSFVFSDGLELRGVYVLLRYIGRASGISHFYDRGAFESSQIDEWLDYAPILSSGSEFENACKYIDSFLEKRTFLVGHSLSIADIAIWSGLAGTEFTS
ncbi:hypothetical protein Tsubulata_024499 [Turnera subulata]|uniref:GST C-terminal domain-containing protein n=1 Tax=Turnera subulata TaxID=218843 RepID=A0A9Q0F852_9ROSI|nr:hypothetical protein Tsubulata_024499 [Turnera subulata]